MADIRLLRRPEPHDLAMLLHRLPEEQRGVAELLANEDSALRYPEVAVRLGIHLGSVLTYLRRIHQRRPKGYALLMSVRQQRLTKRHVEATARAKAHSREWHRRQANRCYYNRFGQWPWERRQLFTGHLRTKR